MKKYSFLFNQKLVSVPCLIEGVFICTLINNGNVPVHKVFIQVFPFGRSHSMASGPGTGAMTACGTGVGNLFRLLCPVSLITSKARAATRRACMPALAPPEPPGPAGGGSVHFPYRRVKGGCCGHGLGSFAFCRRLPDGITLFLCRSSLDNSKCFRNKRRNCVMWSSLAE